MKPWTLKDDRFLHAYHGVGANALADDLGRSASSVKKRIARLKATGAWEQLNRLSHAETGYRVKLGIPLMDDIRERWEEAERRGTTMSEVQ